MQVKLVPVAVRKQLASKDWLQREQAEREIAKAIVEGVAGFTISRAPAKVSVAPSQNRGKRHD